MEKERIRAPVFDDIVFERRNKEYGAYRLRKKYHRNVIIALFISIVIMFAATIIPYLNAKALESILKRTERQVEIQIENLDTPNETVTPPPPPPPPPQDVVRQVKYVPPVVVDSIKSEEAQQLMTADEAVVEVRDEEVVEIVEEVKKEVQEEEPEPEPFMYVEEMPLFPGGDIALLEYIAKHTVYPEIAKENNIQGKVIVKFCVTSKGEVTQVSILKGVDPELDAEAIRVVESLPTFKPGKQFGKPVPVWYSLPINFGLL